MKNTFYGKTNFFFQRDFFGKIGKKRTLFYYQMDTFLLLEKCGKCAA